MSDASASAFKELRIKTSSVKRLVKDLSSYSAEVIKETNKLESMKAASADVHDVKHQENVLAEASMMIPDVKQRLESALGDLQLLMSDFEGDEFAEAEEVKIANETIDAASAAQAEA
mmetsp:Transcript_7640/g.19744  ORF Transcript_7640/g.19744 Transcript_7640/m.19744 type:complete len:117 (+) Transcript_7640:83-433(+)